MVHLSTASQLPQPPLVPLANIAHHARKEGKRGVLNLFLGLTVALGCLFLFFQSFREHWLIFVLWTIFGQLVYFLYGYRHSKLNKKNA